MSKQTSHSGSAGFRWLRSVLAFRHRNPVARFVSTIVAFAMATFLVVGTGVAYGDGTSTPTDTTTPSADTSTTSTGSTSTADPTTTSDPAPAADPAPTTTSATTTTSSSSTTSSPKNFTKLSAPAPIVVPNQALATPITNTAGFEIDGDTIDGNNGGSDFVDGDKAVEGLRDAQGYQGTNKLQDDPSTWAGAQVATEKMDMVNLWVRTLTDGPRSAFGIQRDAANGTTAFYFEYNHKPNLSGDVAKPDRSPNDVMFGFEQTGNNAGNKLSFQQAYVYVLMSSAAWNAQGTTCTQVLSSDPAGGWCTLGTQNGVFYSATSDGSGNGAANTYPEGIFAEGIVDFSKLSFPQGTCLGALGHLNVRSQSSLEWTSAMQDFAVADVSIDSTCGSLTVLKKGLTGDTLIPGAIYGIVDDPRPGETGTYTVFDGTQAQLDAINASADPAPSGTVADGVANGKIEIDNAEPDTYTVTELRAPAGYLLPADRDQQVTVGAVGSQDPRNPVVTFRDPKQWSPLTASKTATGHYDVGWDITKQVTDKASPVEADWSSSATAYSSSTSYDFKYRVRVSQLAASNYRVTGAVTVHNTNTAAVAANVTEAPGITGATCAFDAGQGVASDGSITVAPDDDPATTVVEDAGTSYSYTCTFSMPPAAGPSATGTNTAHLEWSRSAYPQTQDDVDGNNGTDPFEANPAHGYAFTPAEGQPVNVTVQDIATVDGSPVHHAFTSSETGGAGAIDADGNWTLTWTPGGGPYTATYSRTITGTAGECTADGANPNTASVYKTGAATPLDFSTANAKLCVGADLTVTKVVNESLTRTYLWSVEKHACTLASIFCDLLGAPTLPADPATGDATANYTVKLTQSGTQDSAWAMGGTITVHNPNSWNGADITLTDITDVYSGGGDCSITASKTGGTTDASIDYVVPAGGSKVYVYSCIFDQASPPALGGTNTATVTWDAAYTPSGTASNTPVVVASGDWAETPVNKTVYVWDQLEDGTPRLIGQATYGTDTSPKYFEYTATVHSDAGTCTPYQNTAWLSSSSTDSTLHVGTPDTAQVDVCNKLLLTVEKTATGHFNRTYNWQLDKFVDSNASDPTWDSSTSTWTGRGQTHSFAYRVLLSQLPWTDSGFVMTGSITLTNPNTDESIPGMSSTVTEVPDVGADATCVVDGGTDDGVSLVGYQTPVIASGHNLVIDYRCTVGDLPSSQYVDGAYTGGENAVTATNASNSPASTPMTFTKASESQKTVTVSDDMTTLEAPTTVTYDEANPEATYHWDYTLDHTADGLACQDFTNHASVSVTGSPTAAILPVSPLDTAEATATVCPQAWVVSKTTNVGDGTVPVDSNIVYTLTAHKTSEANPTDVVLTDDLSALAAYADIPSSISTPAGQSASISGNVLTWTIDELGATDATLSFTVHVRATSYAVDLPNAVVSAGSSNCPTKASTTTHDECTTDNGTPAQVLPPQVSPPKQHHPSVLPNTGGPDRWLLAAGLALLLAGAGLVAGDRRRKHRG